MNQKNKKYFYSEIEDQVIVNFIKEDFLNRQQQRKQYELTWELNLNFYLGNQFSYISNAGEINDVEKQYYWENREVFNHIAPIIEARLSKLNKVKPLLNIRPSSGSDKDIYSAKLAKSILQSTIDKCSLSSIISTANYWSEITGTSFYKLSWDDALGDTIGVIDKQEIKNGDVTISVCSPFEIYPDSNSSIEIEDCESIIEARAYPVKYINSIWNTNFVGENIDLFDINNNSFLSGMSGRSNITKVIHSTKQDHILLIERYEKPTKNRLNGRHTIICGDTLLYDGDLPYNLGKNGNKSYPFIKQVSTKQITSFWGMSVIERCIPLQRTYNAIKNKKHELIARLASGVLAVEDGSIDIDNLEDEGLAPGKILIYRNGTTPPKFLDAGSIPPEFDDEENKLRSEMNSLACISDITTNSSIPSNVNSGSAISMLINQDESRLSLTAEHIRECIRKIGVGIIRLYKQFAKKVRLGKINDSNNIMQIFYWNNSDLTSDDVIFEYDNELENSTENLKSLILSLYDKGLLSDENGKTSSDAKHKILEMLGFKNWEYYDDLIENHKSRAHKENLQLLKLDSPLDIDEHSIHIVEHTKFLISDQSSNVDNDFKEKLLKHIKEHKQKQNFIKEN